MYFESGKGVYLNNKKWYIALSFAQLLKKLHPTRTLHFICKYFSEEYYLFWEMPVQIEIHQSETMGSKSENLDITLAHG